MRLRLQGALAVLRRDPRWLFASLLLCFSVAGQLWLGFYTSWTQTLTAVGVTVLTELSAGRLFRNEWVNPISAVMTGLSISILLTVGPNRYWPYCVAALVAIGSKYLVRYKGAHVFNPSNLGVATILLLWPAYGVINPSQWTNATWPTLMILALGFIVSYRVRRLDTVLTFLIAYVILGVLRSLSLQHSPAYAIGPIVGSEFQLFMFFMLTDPKTTPVTARGRILYAVIIACVDAVLRVMRVTYSEIYALTLSCTLVPLLNHYFAWTSGAPQRPPEAHKSATA